MVERRTLYRNKSGFTLVEMMVAVALFGIVMLIAIGALSSLVAANKKAQALQSVMNNLNVSLDSMVRNARMGTNFHCGLGVFSIPQNCADNINGDTTFAFEPYGGNVGSQDQWVFQFVAPSGANGGYIQRSQDGGQTWLRLTAPEVSITFMRFFVVGTARGPGQTTQPKVLVVLSGIAGVKGTKTQTTFHIQATAVQRVLNI